MFKDVLNHAHLAHWAEAGLLIFFVTFIGIALWTLTCSRKKLDRWAELPLDRSESGDQHE
jgi:hypothetical protein